MGARARTRTWSPGQKIGASPRARTTPRPGIERVAVMCGVLPPVRIARTVSRSGCQGQRLEGLGKGTDSCLGLLAQPVALRQPARIVVGEPGAALRVLPDQ